MSDRDLTPAEALAEVEAFFGGEWMVIAPQQGGTEDAGEECYVSAWRGVVGLHAFAPTYRAAVDALKQSWRDAVRPWVIAGVKAAHENVGDDGGSLIDAPAAIVARVLKEDL